MDVKNLETDIIKVGKVIKEASSCNLETLTDAKEKVDNAIGDLKEADAKMWSVISLKEENTGVSQARLSMLHKIETAEITRLITMAQGFSGTLKSLIYNRLK